MEFMEDKLVVIKRFSSTLGEYNRPTKELKEVGSYPCHLAQDTTTTSQLQPQKKNSTDFSLYLDPDADIQVGDVLYIYEMDEYDKPIASTEQKAIADKPYKKRTHKKVPLLSEEEV